jgi:ectoine hydroxylase-related dioxygenase (phytanoyl-CoA dioxygenase family)
MISTPSINLSAQQLAMFADCGYLTLPSFLSKELIGMLKNEVDHWVDSGLRKKSIAGCKDIDPPPVMELELGEHGWLISYPPLMAILTQLMGPKFTFHHLHSDRHNHGHASKSWHHDYVQNSQASRLPAMVHVFHYLDGLNGTIGDLVLVPGSQHRIVDKEVLECLGVRPLLGEVVINSLPPGSTVIAHSGVFHTRRAQPGGEGQSRYFIDCSYCQVGVFWASVKPYWRSMLARGRALGFDRGQWPELFAERHFYDP